MGSGVVHSYEEYLLSEDEDESEYPLGYFDDSSDSCEEEGEQDGHLAAPHFSSERLERDSELDTVSFENESAMSDENEYTAEEWAAWEAGAHDSEEIGGAGFYDEETYFEEDAGFDSSDDYY
ncbi:hypothetical protein CYMTET_13366 [Cymbomonas tetramitiformis]|uniref:Uncharacterized protein n=1 Tax=Cymbomonas tetramitiformis TaxID=36881 RepID=A0AAE0LB58_9CHLO|nr:hypothetical protein CYMTET_13366 [Cymbomonas tetramitiformis]